MSILAKYQKAVAAIRAEYRQLNRLEFATVSSADLVNLATNTTLKQPPTVLNLSKAGALLLLASSRYLNSSPSQSLTDEETRKTILLGLSKIREDIIERLCELYK
jgi:hypothetical protein